MDARAWTRMESVPWRQRGTYVGRWLWLLGASDTREGVGVTVLHEEGGEVGVRRARSAEPTRFCLIKEKIPKFGILSV